MALDARNLTRLRRRLHALAEPSGREEATAAFIAEQLTTCGPDLLLTELGGHGVLAMFAGTEPGPSVMLRAELDALPLPETLDIDHASFTPGISHKCGHDGHMAMLLGVADMLGRRRPDGGRILLLFQPAEETGAGAAAVLADDRFAGLHPDWIFAPHNLPGYAPGTVVTAPGTFCAASTGLDVTLTGRSSHAAYPEQGLSPDRALAELVLELVNLPDHLPHEDHLALVTVVHGRLGRPAFGIAPAQAEILATLRADRDEILDRLQTAAEKAVIRISDAYGLQHEIVWPEPFPAVINDSRAVALVTRTARELGLDCTAPAESPFRWSEDFGRLADLGRGAMLGLGSGQDTPGLHAEDYDFPDAILPGAVALLHALCLAPSMAPL